MNCDKCGQKMAERKATEKTPYFYDLGGGFLLSGIMVMRCPTCGMETPMIPKIAQLHRKMVEILIAKPSVLTGPEIRFLRKSAGFPAKEFAALVGVTASHLSRVENVKDGLESLGVPADKLARLLSTEGESARDGLLKLAKRTLEAEKEGKMGAPACRAFRLIRGGGWQEAA